jgi:hypothetical protein
LKDLVKYLLGANHKIAVEMKKVCIELTVLMTVNVKTNILGMDTVLVLQIVLMKKTANLTNTHSNTMLMVKLRNSAVMSVSLKTVCKKIWVLMVLKELRDVFVLKDTGNSTVLTNVKKNLHNHVDLNSTLLEKNGVKKAAILLKASKSLELSRINVVVKIIMSGNHLVKHVNKIVEILNFVLDYLSTNSVLLISVCLVVLKIKDLKKNLLLTVNTVDVKKICSIIQ